MKGKRISIAFFIDSLGMGGVEKSLLNLLKKLVKDNKYNIDVYTFRKEGELCLDIEKLVNVYEITEYKKIFIPNAKTQVKNHLKHGNLKEAIKIVARKSNSKFSNKDRNFEALKMSNLDKEYDVAIAYQVPVSPITIYVSEKVRAKKKILWCHMDIASVPQNVLSKYNRFFENYDNFFCISKEGVRKFREIVPNTDNKCKHFPNIILKDEIIKDANEKVTFDDNYNGVKILTVARLAESKGHGLVIKAMNKLAKDGCNVKWYFVGSGEEENKIREEIEQYGLQDKIILLGGKINPYPYMKKCDIYVQPSEFEGYCITTTEAKILSKAIITTNTDGAKEKFINNEDSIIIDYDVDEMVKAIKKLIEDVAFKNKIESNSNLSYNQLEDITELEKICGVNNG